MILTAIIAAIIGKCIVKDYAKSIPDAILIARNMRGIKIR